MEKYMTLPEDIEAVTNREVVKQNKISLAAIGFIVIALGFTVWGFTITDPNSSLATFLYTAAVSLGIIGVFKLCMGRNCYLFKPTGSRLKKLCIYFDDKESQTLQYCMESKRFDDILRMKRQDNTGVKVDIMLASDKKFMAVQLSEYIPYTYQAISPVMCYYGEEAKRLAQVMEK